jgi:hypothetical protein
VDGEIRFDPILLRTEDLVPSPEEWKVHTTNGSWETIVIPPQSLGMTLCQVPVIVTLSPDLPSIEVTFADGTRREIGGVQIDRETSRAIFERTGRVVRVVARIPNDLARAPSEDRA